MRLRLIVAIDGLGVDPRLQGVTGLQGAMAWRSWVGDSRVIDDVLADALVALS